MTAKDKGTGKENTIKIQDGSGLSKEEIDRMVKDAEAHAEEDKARREEAEVRNQAESLVHQTEKFIKDNEDKVPADVKEKVEAAVKEAKNALAGSDIAAVKSAVEKLATESQALGQAIYEAQAADGAAAGDGAAARRRRCRRRRGRRRADRFGQEVTSGKPEQEPVTVTDKRRIDPETFEVRDAAESSEGTGAPAEGTVENEGTVNEGVVENEDGEEVRVEEIVSTEAELANVPRICSASPRSTPTTVAGPNARRPPSASPRRPRWWRSSSTSSTIWIGPVPTATSNPDR